MGSSSEALTGKAVASGEFVPVVDGNKKGSIVVEEEGFYRSSQMSLIQLYIPTEAAQAVVAELGELGAVQFRDLNSEISSFQRTFTGEIRKLDEKERRIRVLLEQAEKEDVTVRSWMSAGPFAGDGSMVSLRGKALQEVDELDAQLIDAESRILKMDENQKEVQSRYLHTLEWHAVMKALAPFLLQQQDERNISGIGNKAIEDGEESSASDLSQDAHSMELGGPAAAQGAAEASFVAGSVPSHKLAAFERVLWRALRGNVFIRSTECPMEVESGITSKTEVKSAYVAYVHGHETLSRLRKICEALGSTVFNVDPSPERRNVLLEELTGKLEDMYSLLFNTRQAKRSALAKVSESLERWLLLVRKKKALFDTMNKFSCDNDIATRKYYVAEGWCCTTSLPTIDSSIKMASERAGMHVAPVLTILDNGNREPPTHFPVNRFTQVYQDMSDSYGIAKYKEANPSIFMIISFPFLFAVMFGDIGHGFIMALFAAWMVLDERRIASGKQDEIFALIFSGRYVILLMGIFSLFTGLVYNDIFSRSLAIFPSGWKMVVGSTEMVRTNVDYVYPFGIDPAWSFSGNAMIFLNSYKMKISVLLGFVQMMFGLVVALSNLIYFDTKVDIICTWVPQVIFMSAIYGYLSFMIMYKWIVGWDVSVLNVLIGMILKFGSVEGPPIYAGQQMVQTFLITLALICVPWMFAAKPLYLMMQKRRHTTEAQPSGYLPTSEHSDSTGTESVSSTTRKAAAEDDEHEMGEVWVHQLIHTIEFALGSVSNTASYLRLWALSLAHAELSDVLWGMTIGKGVGNAIILTLVYPLWFGFTIGILVAMEGMSAYLHALRLHWVEFNNKFYLCGGTKFEPFSLRDDLMLAEPE